MNSLTARGGGSSALTRSLDSQPESCAVQAAHSHPSPMNRQLPHTPPLPTSPIPLTAAGRGVETATCRLPPWTSAPGPKVVSPGNRAGRRAAARNVALTHKRQAERREPGIWGQSRGIWHSWCVRQEQRSCSLTLPYFISPGNSARLSSSHGRLLKQPPIRTSHLHGDRAALSGPLRDPERSRFRCLRTQTHTRRARIFIVRPETRADVTRCLFKALVRSLLSIKQRVPCHHGD